MSNAAKNFNILATSLKAPIIQLFL